ncbi:MAG TPA: carboxylesterase family protein [Paracoccaceae bacterium]|nr:carboxylesterase family protein [Paracoccaceae bacterium]
MMTVWRTLHAAASVSLGMSVAPMAMAEGSMIAATAGGQVRGADLGEVTVYYGIPYAAPPVGALRWTPPQPAEGWEGVRDGTLPPSQCPQNAELGVFSKPGGSEDCLYLNVYVPRETDGGSLPVLAWIHGGGYFVGTGNDYDGTKLAVEGKAIVVTINYRLGILGFLAHPALDAEGHAFGNYGLMDQQAALRWVKDNIAAFGGDPGNVTIFGESSGGTSVMSHLVSPDSAGLFQHAISMSGAAIILEWPNFGAPPPIEAAREKGRAFAEAAGCADQSAACLRALPVEMLVVTQPAYMTNQAFIDGTVLPMTYAEAFRTGQFNRVTLINGNTLDEWRWAVGFAENASGQAMTEEAYPEAMAGYYGEEIAKRVMEVYSLDKFQNPSEAYGAAATASLFACTGRKANEWISQHMPVYAYEFADRTAPSYLEPTTFPLGAAHTYEIPYLFEGFHGGAGIPTKLNPLQARLSAKMIEYWAGASKAGERTGEWPAYDPARDNYMFLALPAPMMTEGRFSAFHNCDFWDQLGIY